MAVKYLDQLGVTSLWKVIKNKLDGKSSTGHTHSQYSLTSHTHSNYAAASHTHSQYATTGDLASVEEVMATAVGQTVQLAGFVSDGTDGTIKLPSGTTYDTLVDGINSMLTVGEEADTNIKKEHLYNQMYTIYIDKSSPFFSGTTTYLNLNWNDLLNKAEDYLDASGDGYMARTCIVYYATSGSAFNIKISEATNNTRFLKNPQKFLFHNKQSSAVNVTIKNANSGNYNLVFNSTSGNSSGLTITLNAYDMLEIEAYAIGGAISSTTNKTWDTLKSTSSPSNIINGMGSTTNIFSNPKVIVSWKIFPKSCANYS